MIVIRCHQGSPTTCQNPAVAITSHIQTSLIEPPSTKSDPHHQTTSTSTLRPPPHHVHLFYHYFHTSSTSTVTLVRHRLLPGLRSVRAGILVSGRPRRPVRVAPPRARINRLRRPASTPTRVDDDAVTSQLSHGGGRRGASSPPGRGRGGARTVIAGGTETEGWPWWRGLMNG